MRGASGRKEKKETHEKKNRKEEETHVKKKKIAENELLKVAPFRRRLIEFLWTEVAADCRLESGGRPVGKPLRSAIREKTADWAPRGVRSKRPLRVRRFGKPGGGSVSAVY